MGADQIQAIRDRVAALPIGPLPAPWRDRGRVVVEGLTEIGLGVGDDAAEHVLIVGPHGRTVVSAAGRQVAHSAHPPCDDWYSPTRLTALGIGPLRGQLVGLAGESLYCAR